MVSNIYGDIFFSIPFSMCILMIQGVMVYQQNQTPQIDCSAAQN